MPNFQIRSRSLATLVIGYSLLGGGIIACSSNPESTAATKPASSDRESRIEALQVVDCLLPGQTRMLGNRPYVTPRRPATLTAAECRTRGGEYVAYDRADFKTSLQVWMPSAEEGDAQAQANVGEIFEKGAGGTPNYEAAAIWYRKAAEQGNKRGQFNLGTLYEQGLGVEKDPVLALGWYRQAWGLPQDSLVFQSAVDKQQKTLLETMNKNIRKKDLQINAMKTQMASLSANLNKQSNNEALNEQVKELQALVTELENENNAIKTQKVAIEARSDGLKLRTPSTSAALPKVEGSASEISVADINFGKYYALVIGVEKYDKINDLDTPVNDINTIASILTKNYGFEVQKVINADDIGIMESINNINSKLTENDNLLIFYAGHGARLQSGDLESGYWLPTNAEAPPRDTYWVANEFVTRHLARFDAKRILVVADSCYAGLLSSAPGFLMMGEDGKYSNDYIKYKAPKRSRLLLTSGGDEPVLDSDGGEHSIFTKAFIGVLENNTEILTGPQLYMQIRERMAKKSKDLNFEQSPEYKTIKGAGHEVGDFFFVPQSKS